MSLVLSSCPGYFSLFLVLSAYPSVHHPVPGFDSLSLDFFSLVWPRVNCLSLGLSSCLRLCQPVHGLVIVSLGLPACSYGCPPVQGSFSCPWVCQPGRSQGLLSFLGYVSLSLGLSSCHSVLGSVILTQGPSACLWVCQHGLCQCLSASPWVGHPLSCSVILSQDSSSYFCVCQTVSGSVSLS